MPPNHPDQSEAEFREAVQTHFDYLEGCIQGLMMALGTRCAMIDRLGRAKAPEFAVIREWEARVHDATFEIMTGNAPGGPGNAAPASQAYAGGIQAVARALQSFR